MSPPPIIMGYYPYIRAGVEYPPRNILGEIDACLATNPWYRDRVTFLAGNESASQVLKERGLQVTKSFDDAPARVLHNQAHWMKHWMVLWAVRTYGEVLWLDWDTVSTRMPDEGFWTWAREPGAPRFLLIPNYRHARVNCAVLYVPKSWEDAMERSFDSGIESFNDEHLWEAVLPGDVLERPSFWWGDAALQVSGPHALSTIKPGLFFAHVKEFSLAEDIRATWRGRVQDEQLATRNHRA